MAQLVYDKTGRLLFTKEMAQEYTILAPQMLPDHFAMLENILQEAGYKVKMLNTTGHTILEEGQKYVHNDACFPAILVIGQLIDAIHRGGYDPHKVATPTSWPLSSRRPAAAVVRPTTCICSGRRLHGQASTMCPWCP